MLTKIVSGGQTGVDQGSLDAALELGFIVGGYCPKGKLDENGMMPERFHFLEETKTSEWSERTEMNMIHSDGTLIIASKRLVGGTKLTEELAEKHKKTCLVVTPEEFDLAAIQAWLQDNNIETLNIAGPRESQEPSIQKTATDKITQLILHCQVSPRSKL